MFFIFFAVCLARKMHFWTIFLNFSSQGFHCNFFFSHAFFSAILFVPLPNRWKWAENGPRMATVNNPIPAWAIWAEYILLCAVLYTPPHVPPDFAGLCRTLLDSAGLCWTLLDSAGLCWTWPNSNLVTYCHMLDPPESAGDHWNIKLKKLSVVQRRAPLKPFVLCLRFEEPDVC